MCALGSFHLFSAVKPVRAQAVSMMYTLYRVKIPKPGFKFGDPPNISMQQHTTILMNCRPLVYVHWKEKKQHNWVKTEKNLRECVTAARRAACRSGVATAVQWDSGWNTCNILSDQI